MRVTFYRTRRNPDAPLCDPRFDQIDNLKPNAEVALPKAADLLGVRKDDVADVGLKMRQNPSGRPFVRSDDLKRFADDLEPVHLAETDAPPADPDVDDETDDQDVDLDLDASEAAIILPIRVLRRLFGVSADRAPAPADADEEDDDMPPPARNTRPLRRPGR